MGELLNLQDFAKQEPAPEQADSTANLDLAYANGFEAGKLAATAEQDEMNNALVNAVEARAFTYAEARRDVMQQILPLMQAIADKLVPELAQASLGPRLCDTLASMSDEVIAAGVIIRANSQTIDAVRRGLQGSSVAHIECLVEDTLQSDVVEISGVGIETSIDMSSLIAEFSEAFAGCIDQLQSEEQHG